MNLQYNLYPTLVLGLCDTDAFVGDNPLPGHDGLVILVHRGCRDAVVGVKNVRHEHNVAGLSIING